MWSVFSRSLYWNTLETIGERWSRRRWWLRIWFGCSMSSSLSCVRRQADERVLWSRSSQTAWSLIAQPIAHRWLQRRRGNLVCPGYTSEGRSGKRLTVSTSFNLPLKSTWLRHVLPNSLWSIQEANYCPRSLAAGFRNVLLEVKSSPIQDLLKLEEWDACAPEKSDNGGRAAPIEVHKSLASVPCFVLWLQFTVNFLIRAAEAYICKVSVSRLGVQMHFDGIALLPTPTITLHFAADKSKLSQALSQSFQEIQVQTYPMYLCIHLTINMLTREFSISHVGSVSCRSNTSASYSFSRSIKHEIAIPWLRFFESKCFYIRQYSGPHISIRLHICVACRSGALANLYKRWCLHFLIIANRQFQVSSDLIFCSLWSAFIIIQICCRMAISM